MTYRWAGVYVHDVWVRKPKGRVLGRFVYERPVVPPTREFVNQVCIQDDLPDTPGVSYDPSRVSQSIYILLTKKAEVYFMNELLVSNVSRFITCLTINVIQAEKTIGNLPLQAWYIHQALCDPKKARGALHSAEIGAGFVPFYIARAGKGGLRLLWQELADALAITQYRRRGSLMSISVLSPLIAEAYYRRRVCGGGAWICTDFPHDNTKRTVTTLVCVWSWDRWRFWIARGIPSYDIAGIIDAVAVLSDHNEPLYQCSFTQLDKKLVSRYIYVHFPRLVAAMLLWGIDFFQRSSSSPLYRYLTTRIIPCNDIHNTSVYDLSKCRLRYIDDHAFLVLYKPLLSHCQVLHPLSKRAGASIAAKQLSMWPILYAPITNQQYLLDVLGITERDVEWFDEYISTDLVDTAAFIGLYNM